MQRLGNMSSKFPLGKKDKKNKKKGKKKKKEKEKRKKGKKIIVTSEMI